jgi:acetyl-CoA carboxylase biotin carboxyl carrier protein
MRIEDIKDLINLCSEKKIAEVDIEMKGIKVRIVSGAVARPIEYVQAVPMAQPMPAYAPQAALPAPAAAGAPAPAPAPAPEAAPARKGVEILSPMVGTCYRAPAPDAAPFVDVGQRVTPDTVVCIIEAMKLMNEIKAEVSGRITKVLVKNGQPVEFNQPLFEVEP